MTNTSSNFQFSLKGQLFLLDIISIRTQINILHYSKKPFVITRGELRISWIPYEI